MILAMSDPERLSFAFEMIGAGVVAALVLWLLTTLRQTCSMSRDESPLRQQLRHIAEMHDQDADK